MDVWETVVAGSTLISGDFWEHLNAQEGGAGGVEYVLVDAVRDVDAGSVASISVVVDVLESEITTVLSVSSIDQQFTAECNDIFEVSI